MENKYSIYKLKNKSIKCKMPERLGGFDINGHVKNIERDILNNKIILTVDDQQFILKEPKSINFQKSPSERVIFTYGEILKEDMEDEELLSELRNGGYLDEILKSHTTDAVFFVQFEIVNNIPVVDSTIKKRKHKKKRKKTYGKKKLKRSK